MDYTYNDFEEGVDKIYNNIIATGTPFTRVVGIARGGLFLATRLSYKLQLPLTTISWSLRDGGDQESNLWLPVDINEGSKIILVEDIVDGGNTIKSLFQDWESNIVEPLKKENISIAACFYNISQDIIPDFWHKTIDRKVDKEWINFWWEQ